MIKTSVSIDFSIDSPGFHWHIQNVVNRHMHDVHRFNFESPILTI